MIIFISFVSKINGSCFVLLLYPVRVCYMTGVLHPDLIVLSRISNIQTFYELSSLESCFFPSTVNAI